MHPDEVCLPFPLPFPFRESSVFVLPLLSHTVVSVSISGLFFQMSLYCTYMYLPLACNMLAFVEGLSFIEIFSHFSWVFSDPILVSLHHYIELSVQ